jgi:predicted Zn-dependent protease
VNGDDDRPDDDPFDGAWRADDDGDDLLDDDLLPDDPVMAAAVLLGRGRAAQALEVLERELPARADDHRLQTVRAAALLDLDRTGEAVQLIHSILERVPEALEARLLLVELLLSRRQPRDALTMLDGMGPAVQLSTQAMRLRSMALVELGYIREAHEAATEAVRLDQSDIAALLQLARLRLSGGNVDDAEQLALHALMVEPEHPAVLEFLAFVKGRRR